MEDQIPNIMENVFECTLEMINKDFSEYPEHRVQFFTLLRAINLYCFPALLRLDARQFKFVIDSCLWASKHDNRDVESAGLNMCIELMNNMAETDTQTCNTFFQTFFTNILQDVFFVLTDSDHKAGFKYQSTLLAKMFWLVDCGKVQGPIYGPETPAGTSNKDFLGQYVQNLLSNAFSNLQPVQISNFVNSMFEYNADLARFKLTLRDFLISLREFSSGDTAELFAEDREQAAKEAQATERERAMKVGGLIKPADLEDDEL
jgi:exportin-1